MIPSHIFGLNWPIGIEDTMARRWSNRPGQCEAWQFGPIEIRVAELAMILPAIAASLQRGRCIATHYVTSPEDDPCR
jgi:hypothetical protein